MQHQSASHLSYCFHAPGSAVVLDESDKSRQAGRGEPVFPLFQVYPGAIFGERCLLEIDKKYHMTVSCCI
jgi:hypothetical protein